MDVGSMSNLQEEAADAVDNKWTYSMHWERDGFGNLTFDGWRKALLDLDLQVAMIHNRLRRLSQVRPKILAEIEKRERWAREEEA